MDKTTLAIQSILVIMYTLPFIVLGEEYIAYTIPYVAGILAIIFLSIYRKFFTRSLIYVFLFIYSLVLSYFVYGFNFILLLYYTTLSVASIYHSLLLPKTPLFRRRIVLKSLASFFIPLSLVTLYFYVVIVYVIGRLEHTMAYSITGYTEVIRILIALFLIIVFYKLYIYTRDFIEELSSIRYSRLYDMAKEKLRSYIDYLRSLREQSYYPELPEFRMLKYLINILSIVMGLIMYYPLIHSLLNKFIYEKYMLTEYTRLTTSLIIVLATSIPLIHGLNKLVYRIGVRSDWKELGKGLLWTILAILLWLVLAYLVK